MLDLDSLRLNMNGMTIMQLSRISGIQYASLWNIVRGKNVNIRMKTLDKLADALGVSPSELVK